MAIPKWISDHPVRSGLLALAGFLLWKFPEWLGNVWPLFTTKTIPVWAAEQRWPAMTHGVFDWLTWVIGAALLALSIAIYRQTPKVPAIKPHDPERLKAAESERDALRLKIRGHAHAVSHLSDALNQTNKELASCRFQAFVSMAEKFQWGEQDVTIRFIEWEDTKYADAIKGLFKDHAPKWSVKTLRVEGHELRQTTHSRIVFASSNTHLTRDLAGIFTLGNYLGESVESVLSEELPLVITVFPMVPRVASKPFAWPPDSGDASSGGTADTDGKT